MEQQQKVESRSQTPRPVATPRPMAAGATATPGSRAASPTLSPSHGGHSVVAKRATSPKIPKPKPLNASRGNSPLGGQSTLGSRATSPVVDPGNPSKKRKAEDSPEKVNPSNQPPVVNGGAIPKPKKRKPVPVVSTISVTSAELEALLLDWLKNTANATTRDCIHHFTPYLTDNEKKKEFSAMVRKLAFLKNGNLVIKRAGSSAPSPPAI